MAPSGGGQCLCFLVGFGVAGLGQEHYRTPPRPPVPRRRRRPSTDTREPWICDPTPVPDLASKHVFMLVARVTKTRPGRSDVYALLGPSNGPGELYRIHGKECFYLPRFRMQPASLQSRGDLRSQAWSNEVLNACCRPVPQAHISASATQTRTPKTAISTPQACHLSSKFQTNILPQPVPTTNEETNSHGCEDPFDFEEFLYGEGQEGLEPTNDYGNEEPFDFEAFLYGED